MGMLYLVAITNGNFSTMVAEPTFTDKKCFNQTHSKATFKEYGWIKLMKMVHTVDRVDKRIMNKDDNDNDQFCQTKLSVSPPAMVWLTCLIENTLKNMLYWIYWIYID